MKCLKRVVFLLLFFESSSLFAWRELGHFSICEIGYRNLKSAVKKKIDNLMGDKLFPTECTWPDMVRKTDSWKHTFLWHFINLEDGQEYFSNINKKGDILFALIKYEDVLRSKSSTLEEKRIALKFVGHFMGDLHQPLHAGKASDKGGNRIKVSWFGKSSHQYKSVTLNGVKVKKKDISLHKVLDLHILNKFMEVKKLKDSSPYSFKIFSSYLMRSIGSKREDWTKGTYFDWMNESLEKRTALYEVGNKRLGQQYYKKSIPIILESIQRAGIRLAERLNLIFSGQKYSRKDRELKEKMVKFGKKIN
jgi:hypothetical protein